MVDSSALPVAAALALLSIGTSCQDDRGAAHDLPATGPLDPALAGVDDVMVRLVSQLCIGGAVLAIARDGELLAARGYGYLDGPPSPECASPRDPFVGGAPVSPDTPFRIGSIGKNIGAILVRRALADALDAAGEPADDAAIEALPLLDGPLRLLPERTEAILAGRQPPAFPVAGSACSERADPRWAAITVGHLLSHRAGLPGAYPDLFEGARLLALRGVDTPADLAAEEARVDPPARAIRRGPGRDGYFVPSPTIDESITALGGVCLAADPGAAAHYSNMGFDLLSLVGATVSGRLEVARGGDPASHEGSLLDRLLRDELGLAAGARSRHGVALSDPYIGARDPAEPRYRRWDPLARTYYPRYRDPKRPFCELDRDGACTFDRWRDQSRPVNHQWQRRRVPLSYEWIGAPVATGLLAAEAPVLLALLGRYWLGRSMSGSDDGPYYGRARALHPSHRNRQHGGNLDGTTAWAAQFVGAPVDYETVPRDPDTDRYDFAAAGDPVHCTTIPAGVDLVIAFNQSESRECHEASTCDAAATRWRALVLAALCAAPWDQVGAAAP